MLGRYKLVGAATATVALLALGGMAMAAPTPAGNFELTGFTASQTKTPGTYDLKVTVTQTSMDGSDLTKGATSEFHAFPQNIYINVVSSAGRTIETDKATLITTGDPGITYDKPGKPGSGSKSVSATADYTFTPSSGLSGSDTLSIYTSKTNGDNETFRMGPYSDNSWADDIVAGTTNLMIPVGQLPEVPLAAALPVVGLGILAVTRLRRRGAANPS